MDASWRRSKLFDDRRERAPILVVGVGNILLKDDGAGIELVNRLSAQADRWGDEVEFLEGGTQGIALLNHISGRRAMVVLDAVALGAEPGTLHVFQDNAIMMLGSLPLSAHEGNAAVLLRIAHLLGGLPARLVLIGIEPETISTGVEFSEPVRSAIPEALQIAKLKIENILSGLRSH
jgi:hydrogenase maturation protease